jgi:hypothetical protein
MLITRDLFKILVQRCHTIFNHLPIRAAIAATKFFGQNLKKNILRSKSANSDNTIPPYRSSGKNKATSWPTNYIRRTE